jgi:hypothetical protein
MISDSCDLMNTVLIGGVCTQKPCFVCDLCMRKLPGVIVPRCVELTIFTSRSTAKRHAILILNLRYSCMLADAAHTSIQGGL